MIFHKKIKIKKFLTELKISMIIIKKLKKIFQIGYLNLN